MYKVMLAFDNGEILEEVKNLHIWGELSEFEIVSVVRDGRSAYKEMKNQRFDLVILDIYITGTDSLQLLRKSKSEKLCDHIALCSEFSNFDYARHGIILGAFDYLVKPFDKNQFYSMFSRIKNENYISDASEELYSEEILCFFEKHDHRVYEYISDIFNKIYNNDNGVLIADRIIQHIFKTVIDEVFKCYEWLDLYISQEDFYLPNVIDENDSNSYKRHYRDKLCELFEEYTALFPNIHNEKLEEVILYILFNPESDLKLKTIADDLHINSSYLSTVFSAHTDIRFVDYLTTVKMKRAGWLLKKTELKVSEIASRLYYKDVRYFSKLFKKQFGVTPSEYHVPNDCDFNI